MHNNRLNHNMVVLARESRGLTQAELADAAKTNQAKLGRIELDIPTEISDKLIEDLSAALHYPPSLFFEKGDIFHSLAPFNYRKRAAFSATLRKVTEAKANLQRIHIQRLLKSLTVETNIPRFDLIGDFNGSAEAAAQALRQIWKVPRGPIKNVTKLLESAGIIIINCDFESTLLDAFTIFDGIIQPIIFVNRQITGDRLRFTLCHEICHITCHEYQRPEIESEADRFAAEFLMPAQDIRPFLHNVSLAHVAELKPGWKCSMGALLYRAKALGMINENQSHYLWAQMAKAGYKVREPATLDFPREEPELLDSLINIHLNTLNIKVEDMSKTLNLYPDEFRAIYLKSNNENGLRTLFTPDKKRFAG